MSEACTAPALWGMPGLSALLLCPGQLLLGALQQPGTDTRPAAVSFNLATAGNHVALLGLGAFFLGGK